ncbi:hypothetical protein HR12_48360, partial [Microbacterium sp. SUBG005]
MDAAAWHPSLVAPSSAERTLMYQLAPNIELLFTEADYHDRVRAARAASTPSRCGVRPASMP